MMRIDVLSRLSEKRIAEIRKLEQVCRDFDKTRSEIFLSNDLNFRRSFKGFYLAYEKNELVAVLSLFAPDYPQAELYAFTRPDKRKQGIFKALLAAARAEMYEWYMEKLIYVIEPQSEAAAAVAEHLQLRHTCSEYLMQLADEPYQAYLASCLSETSDTGVLKESGSNSVNETLYYSFFEAEEDALPLGGARVDVGEQTFFICGVKIEESERSKGYGKALMHKLVAALSKLDSAKAIRLEVSSTNAVALHIYENMGFRVISEIKYYE